MKQSLVSTLPPGGSDPSGSPAGAGGRLKIVLGVVGADCHAVGNKVLDAFFTGTGFEVVNVGVLASQDEFIKAALETNARAILVSSLYGHAEIDCAGMRERCVERGLDPVVLYVGGNLVVGKKPFAEVERKFKRMGFDRVFPPNADLEEVARLLRQDLKAICHDAA